jgi:hypothetical protein
MIFLSRESLSPTLPGKYFNSFLQVGSANIIIVKMCTSSSSQELNKVIAGSAEGKTVVVEYGPYMNWGRWNHNTSRITELLNALTELGYTIELKHEDTETTWEDHGFVRVLSTDGEELASSANVQHNSAFSKRRQTLLEMAETADEALSKA